MDKSLDLLITLGIMLDWAPAYLLGLDSGSISLTKTVVLPLLAFDFLRNPLAYLASRHCFWARALAVGLLVGVGGGVLFGNVDADRLVELLPIVPITAFYSKPRDMAEIRRILQIAIWSSVAVPVCLILSRVGVLAPSQYVGQGAMERIWAGTSSSTSPIYAIIPIASLGGLFLTESRSPLGPRSILYAGIVASGLLTVLLTAQRATFAVVAVVLVAALLVYVAPTGGRGTLRLALIAAPLAGAVLLVPSLVDDLSSSLVMRYEDLGDLPTADAMDLRVTFYRLWWRDLSDGPGLVGPGESLVVQQTGFVPHFIVGEAYYSGGTVLMLVLVLCFIVAAVRTLRVIRRGTGTPEYGLAAVLIFLQIGLLGVLSFYPGLQTRLVYLIVGLSLSSLKSPSKDDHGRSTSRTKGARRAYLRHSSLAPAVVTVPRTPANKEEAIQG